MRRQKSVLAGTIISTLLFAANVFAAQGEVTCRSLLIENAKTAVVKLAKDRSVTKSSLKIIETQAGSCFSKSLGLCSGFDVILRSNLGAERTFMVNVAIKGIVDLNENPAPKCASNIEYVVNGVTEDLTARLNNGGPSAGD